MSLAADLPDLKPDELEHGFDIVDRHAKKFAVTWIEMLQRLPFPPSGWFWEPRVDTRLLPNGDWQMTITPGLAKLPP